METSVAQITANPVLKKRTSLEKRKLAPLTAAQLKQLRLDAKNVRGTAERKQVTLDQWEEAIQVMSGGASGKVVMFVGEG